MRSPRASGRSRRSGTAGASRHERRRAVSRRERGGRMNGIRAPRVVRYVLLACACLGVIFLFLLATASANTALFARGYDLLLVLNVTMVAILMGLVGYQLLRLRRNLKAGVFGSRLAVRLVLLFALVAVLPGALLYGVSVQFLGKSIESWFDVRVDRALEGGLNLGRSALDYLLKETTNKATQLALTLQEAELGGMASRLNRASEQAGIYEAALFSASGGVLAVAGISGSTLTPEPPPAQALRRARLQQTYSAIDQMGDQGLMLRVVVAVNSADPTEPSPKAISAADIPCRVATSWVCSPSRSIR